MLTAATKVQIGSKSLTIAQALRLWKSSRVWRAIVREHAPSARNERDALWARYDAARKAAGWKPGAYDAQSRRKARVAARKPKASTPQPSATTRIAVSPDQLHALKQALAALGM
jgi:hypothetical protein